MRVDASLTVGVRSQLTQSRPASSSLAIMASLITLPPELFDAIASLLSDAGTSLLPLRASCRALEQRLIARLFSVREACSSRNPKLTPARKFGSATA